MIPHPAFDPGERQAWLKAFREHLRSNVGRTLVPAPDSPHDHGQSLSATTRMQWPELVAIPISKSIWPDAHYAGEGIPWSAIGSIDCQDYRYALDLNRSNDQVLVYRKDW